MINFCLVCNRENINYLQIFFSSNILYVELIKAAKFKSDENLWIYSTLDSCLYIYRRTGILLNGC